MNNQEAINYMKSYLDEDVYVPRCVEAHIKAIEALEKQIPVSRFITNGKYYCPNCKSLMPSTGYCKCGQRVY